MDLIISEKLRYSLTCICIKAILLLYSGNSISQTVTFEEGFLVKPESNFNILTEKKHTAPFVTDWDEDGKKDLLVGCFYNADISLYRNIGTNENPVFDEPELLKADGEIIQLGFG